VSSVASRIVQCVELPPTARSEYWNPTFLDHALDAFSPQALWLLLSLERYGWRAHADLAHGLLTNRPSGASPPIDHHYFQHRVMAAVEELFLLLDQFWRTVAGIRAHRRGREFLAAYCLHEGSIHRQFENLLALSGDDWSGVFKTPTDTEIIAACRGDEDGAASWIASADETRRLLPTNIEEVCALFERPREVIGGPTDVSLRDANKRYRHGSRMVYENCSPTESHWIAANPGSGAGLLTPRHDLDSASRAETVNVLMEPPDRGRATFAAISTDKEWCDSLVESMGHLSVTLWRCVFSLQKPWARRL
jgi:hypothetical protein